MENINCKITNACKIFFESLESHFNSSGSCNMGNKELAKLFSRSITTIHRWLKCLKDNNLIRCEYDRSSHKKPRKNPRRKIFILNRNE